MIDPPAGFMSDQIKYANLVEELEQLQEEREQLKSEENYFKTQRMLLELRIVNYKERMESEIYDLKSSSQNLEKNNDEDNKAENVEKKEHDRGR
jgi:hypothetical protein